MSQTGEKDRGGVEMRGEGGSGGWRRSEEDPLGPDWNTNTWDVLSAVSLPKSSRWGVIAIMWS